MRLIKFTQINKHLLAPFLFVQGRKFIEQFFVGLQQLQDHIAVELQH